MTKDDRRRQKMISKLVDNKMNHWRVHLADLVAKWGSQSELSRRTGLNNVYLNRLLHAKQEPSLRTAIKLSEATGVPLRQFIGD
jgi:DNA-binding phage protein